tara:strand:+ start:232 stop:348 length:117 start_codon:yes stop_codon:yes gene_type:complete
MPAEPSYKEVKLKVYYDLKLLAGSLFFGLEEISGIVGR